MPTPASFSDKTGDIAGGRLVLCRDNTKKRVYWKVKCPTCLSVTSVRSDNLHQKCKSCSRKTHGLCKSPEYAAWRSMKQRCGNPKNHAYIDYGGRGITVCQRWQDSFENFLIDMGNRPPGMTLERKDNDGGYNPDNCEWATYSTQNNNRRNLKQFTTRRRPNGR